MADIRKQPSGRYLARYRFRDPRTGALVRRGRTFGTKRQAGEFLARVRIEVLDREHVDPRIADRPFREAMELWRARWPQSIGPKTQARYESVLKTHLLPALGSWRPSSFDRHVAQAYVDDLTVQGLAPASVHKVHACLRATLDAAVRGGWLKANPTVAIELPRLHHREMLFLTAEEVATLALDVNPRYQALIYTAAYTGLRAGELGGLRLGRLNRLKGQLRVEETLVDAGAPLSYGQPKTRGSRRTVSLPPFLCDMLARHLAAYAGADALDPTTSHGTPIRHSGFYREHYKPAVARALPHKAGLRFHDLRHTCAGLLIAQGAHPKVIQERLGHASIAITMDRDGHLLPALDHAVVQGLESTYQAAQARDAKTAPHRDRICRRTHANHAAAPRELHELSAL